jgi:MYXO-CTERM domain-containing protein
VRALRPLVAAGALAVAGAGGAARAAPCGLPDLVDMVPPDQAGDVPINAALAAHYTPSAEYAGEDVVLTWPTGEEQVLPATFDATEGQLRAVPAEPLVPGGAYIVRWPQLRGLDTAAPGCGGLAHFTAGTAADTEAPRFDGVTGVRWDLERRTSDCTDEIEERFIFDVDLGAASDDGGRQELTLILFQSAGPRISGGPVPVLTRALPAEGTPARVALTGDDAIGHVCFAALVRDTTGQVSDSGSREVCLDTTAPPFFRGCNVSGQGGGGAGALAALALLLLAVRTRWGG